MAKKRYLILGGKKEDPTKWSTEKIVNALGELDEKIKQMTTYKKLLRDTLENREGCGTYESNKYKVTLSESLSYEYDNLALYNALKKEKYIRCSKPVIALVKDYIAPAKLQEMILQTKTTIKMYIKKK